MNVTPASFAMHRYPFTVRCRSIRDTPLDANDKLPTCWRHVGVSGILWPTAVATDCNFLETVFKPAIGSAGVSAQVEKTALNRVLDSADFDATARERNFLKYIVEETLAGRADRIKAYSIALEVFGRDASFDPQNDPIVRIAAGHLRRSLERYYLTAGSNDPVVITVPKGGYVPEFEVRDTSPDIRVEDQPKAYFPARFLRNWREIALVGLLIVLAGLVAMSPPIRSWMVLQSRTEPQLPRLVVRTFDDLVGTQSSTASAVGLTGAVIEQLSRFRDGLVVVSQDDAESEQGYLLSGQLGVAGELTRLQVKLTNRQDGKVIWAESYQARLDGTDSWMAQSEIAQELVISLAQTYGVLYQEERNAAGQIELGKSDPYTCTLSYYAYRATLDPSLRSDVRACLTDAVDRFPHYATAWALFAQVSMDELRFNFPYDLIPAEKIEPILAMTRRATELDPRNTRAMHAHMSALYWNREFAASREVGLRALAMNPNDADLMGSLGSGLALSGNWNEGCALIDKSLQQSVGPRAYYETVLALCAYFAGDYPGAVVLIRKSPVPKNEIYRLLAAAIHAEAGLAQAASTDRIWLEENAPRLVETVSQVVIRRFGRSEDATFFLNSLRKAGFRIDD